MPISLKERIARQLFEFYVRDMYDDIAYIWNDTSQLTRTRFYKDAETVIAILSRYNPADIEIWQEPKAE